MYKKYGIDIDGVLANFDQAMVKVLKKLGVELPNDFHPTDWNWGNANLPPDGMAQAWAIIDGTENFWESLSPTEDIVTMATFFHEHAEHDCDIYFITARVETTGRSARHQTENWLKEYLGDPRQTINVFVTKSGIAKKEILKALNINYFIDDHLDTIKATSELDSCKSVLLDRPWNQGNRDGLYIVSNLKEFFNENI